MPAATATEEQYAAMEKVLMNDEGPISDRMRTCFTLKSLGTPRAIDALGCGFKANSDLLKHEVAYCIGQIQDTYAIPLLTSVLADADGQGGIVRHEAAEALAAIGDASVLPILEKYVADPVVEVAETCQLAAAVVREKLDTNAPKLANSDTYGSVDPAPALGGNKTVAELRTLLLDTTQSLYDRYKAMFALRDRATDESVLALCDAFGDASALLRHEIAFVLGQMAHPASTDALAAVLANGAEHGMVRHEAAEALGAIDGVDIQATLEKYLHDESAIVRESCVVALDIQEYSTDPNAFQYADGLTK